MVKIGKKQLFLSLSIFIVTIYILYFFVLRLDSYHDTMPKLAAKICIDEARAKSMLPISTGLSDENNSKHAGIYMRFGDVETLQFFNKMGLQQLYTNRFFEKRKMLPLIIQGKKIKFLKSDFMSTNNVEIEFVEGDENTIYCYWVDERFNNFFLSFFV